MLDSGASTNVMSLKVMKLLSLIPVESRPYRNVYAMDSREIKVCGLIKDLQVKLAAYRDISLLMDVLVIDVLDAWGMLLSQKWASNLGGSIQMDLPYATIPTYENTYVTLHQEQMKTYHVDDPQDPMNELVCFEEDLGTCIVLANFTTTREDSNGMWKMNFHGAQSRTRVGTDIGFTSPQYVIHTYAFGILFTPWYCTDFEQSAVSMLTKDWLVLFMPFRG